MDLQERTLTASHKQLRRSVTKRKSRPYSRRTERRFSPPDTNPREGHVRRYYKALDNLIASRSESVSDDGPVFLPSDFFLELIRVLELCYLPLRRYEAWRTADADYSNTGFLAHSYLGIDHDRAREIERDLLALRPVTEISVVAHHEIRNVLNAHRVYGEYQREDVDRMRQNATCSAS